MVNGLKVSRQHGAQNALLTMEATKGKTPSSMKIGCTLKQRARPSLDSQEQVRVDFGQS